MFEILFGWRKASKCKRLIKRVQFRLEVLSNKRDSIIRQLHQDVVHLIKTGHLCSALSRIEQIHKDQTIKAVYDLLHNFSEFITINLSYIRKHRDCPNDINEAVSTLLYASARFGDLPELAKLRKLFCERYGQTFTTTAVELLHGNLVNRQIIEKLSIKSASDDLKLSIIKEIARDNGIQINHFEVNGVLELEWHQKSDTDDGNAASKLQVSYEKQVPEIGKNENLVGANSVDVQSASPTARVSPCNSNQIHSVSIRHHGERDSLCEVEADCHSPCQTNPSVSSANEHCASPLQHTLERITEVEPESPSHFSERQLVYVDDAQDKEKSFSIVKSNIKSTTQCPEEITINLPSGSRDQEKSRSHKRKISSRRRKKSRYVLGENPCTNDVEAALYYGETDDLSPNVNLFGQRVDSQGKHRKKISDAESHYNLLTKSQKKSAAPTSPYICKFKSNQRNGTDVGPGNDASACSLEKPCYFVTGDDQDELKSPYQTWNSTKTLEFPLVNLNTARRKMIEEAEVIDCRRSCPSSHDSSRVASPWRQVKAPYLRAMTMPTRPTEETPNHQIVRSASRLPEHHDQSSIQSPSYIIPKYPKYGIPQPD